MAPCRQAVGREGGSLGGPQVDAGAWLCLLCAERGMDELPFSCAMPSAEDRVSAGRCLSSGHTPGSVQEKVFVFFLDSDGM